MGITKKTISLSPKLKLGVGRGTVKNRIIKTTTTTCLLLALLFGANAIKLFLSSSNKTTQANVTPKILGVTDQDNTLSENVIYKDYVVREGDTLFSLSQKIGIPWTTLAELNKIKPPFSLKPGQVIKIPNNG